MGCHLLRGVTENTSTVFDMGHLEHIFTFICHERRMSDDGSLNAFLRRRCGHRVGEEQCLPSPIYCWSCPWSGALHIPDLHGRLLTSAEATAASANRGRGYLLYSISPQHFCYKCCHDGDVLSRLVCGPVPVMRWPGTDWEDT